MNTTIFAKKNIFLFILLIAVVLLSLAFILSDNGLGETDRKEESVVGEDVEYPLHEIIGESVEDRDIESFTFGNGDDHLLLVGGIHGGYEWNSVILAYKFMDYLNLNQDIIPDNVSVTIIPSLNPDGVYRIIGKEGRFTIDDVPMDIDHAPGRMNANGVDLNRNFDCKWQPESMWRGEVVSAGTSAFSEPEALAFRNIVSEKRPRSVVFWHSQANAVYASECEEGTLSETLDIMNVYANASGYSAIESFDAYEITGDAEGWLASIGIPAITVELRTHEAIEWDKNLMGIKALFEYYNNQ